jgi:hypothetical protein
VAVAAGEALEISGAATLGAGLAMLAEGKSGGVDKSLEQRVKASHKIDSNSEANKFAQSKGYEDAHDLKQAYIKGQRDTNRSHYNIHVNNTTGESFVVHNNNRVIIPILE